MRRILALLVFMLAFVNVARTQTVQNTVVEVSAVAQSSPPRLVFTWPANPTATGYTIQRRAPGSTTWSVVGTAPAAATGWIDSLVAVGEVLEYRFTKSGSPFGLGYATCAIDRPAVHERGKLILLVADTHAAFLTTELARLEQDLVGDGWQVLRHDVSPTSSVASVKSLILNDYLADPANVRAVFLFGHVPVPYSGSVAWDGHPDHAGAWPSDGYYGDINDSWTDTFVNSTVASRLENRNIPGDGKFDQSNFPGELELMVGRVDLASMPSFAASERDLLRAYLEKDHAFRHKLFSAAERAVLDDNFGYFGGEAFAASGWRSFAPMFGAANSVAGDYFGSLNTGSGPGYLWSYGCGGGSYGSAGGVGSTADFALSTNRNVFTLLFGSYHGDWDVADNFMRAALCSGWTLTCSWAGRPAWTYSSMALGEPIGHATRWSQNDPTPSNSIGARGTHMALMGDPSLRMHIAAPPSGVSALLEGGVAKVRWASSPESGASYHVYRSPSPAGPFTLLNASPTADSVFDDPTPLAGASTYMIRAVVAQTSGSGTYANLSQGAFGDADFPLDAPGVARVTELRLRVTGRNPFTTAAEISFQLPAAANTRLAIHDALGREVRVLESGALPAGSYRRGWDGRDAANVPVAPGIYLVRLDAGDATARVKLAHVR